ncbi:hypothetical protein UFOVP152_24 [uncultured Caudovirales phage]|uniref:Terminase-like family n=1 Tax=uncultured Caudovirales phage TaxID=2100421 RepID=A0A6J7WF97_9CAUD|nr:hypothetical protein UFOVP152_24 [uncultured Caudovirales phage]
MNDHTAHLGYFPRHWQRKVHLERRRFTVCALHRRAGKTTMSIAELVDKATRFTLPDGLFFYVAPFLKQAKAIAWRELKARVAPMIQFGAVEINEGELWVRFKSNGAMIRIYGADNPDAMRGVRLDGCVLDEVAQMKPEVWHDIIRPALSDRKGWAIFIGTPKGVNLFSELFYGCEGKADWIAFLFTCYDTHALDPAEIEAMRAEMSDTAFKREMLCDFSAAGDDQLISIADVEEAISRKYRPGEMDYAARVIGVDPARFGDDKSVIIRRQGLVAFPPEVMHGKDNMHLAARVAQHIAEWGPDAVFCDGGNGAGVIDRLRQLGHDIIEVNFGGKAAKAEYVNKRTEIWFEMRDWLAAGGSLPNDASLKQDLAAPTYAFNAANQKVLESKDDIKKRIKRSPDVADALAVTFAAPVERRPDIIVSAPRPRGGQQREYDPYA